MKNSAALFASTHLHDPMSPHDPLDVYTDMAWHSRLGGMWKDGVVPGWCQTLADQLHSSPAMAVSLVTAWLLDHALKGDTAARMQLIRETLRTESDG